MGKYYFDRYRPDLQMTGYCWAAQVLYDCKVSGALINVLYNTTTTQDYKRSISSREPWELDQFLNIVTNYMDEISSIDPEERSQWRPSWTSCTNWGQCNYRDLCLTDEPERLIDFMYKKDKWSPLKEEDFSEDSNEPELKILY